jgi:predicted unusual protein kinase regulating ubiquinone biosynthesis (AarF/ABC1/UbiB family)
MALELAWLERRRAQLPPEDFQRLQDRVLRAQARRLRATALELQGLLIKLGQFLSTRVDVLPPAFTGELADLQDLVPPVPWPVIREQIARELGAPPEQVFADISPVPIASASLGQTHRAVLRDGRVVAVKVQRPGIEELVQIDLDAVRTVLRWVRRWTPIDRRVDVMALCDELERTTREELDYLTEAAHAERFARNFAGQGDIVVPRVYREYSTRRVLVMEFVRGHPVDDRAALAAAGLRPAEVAERIVRTYLQQVLRDGFFHADPHPGNVFVAPDGRLVFLDFGMMGQVTPADRAAMGRFVTGLMRRDLDALVQALRDLGFVRPHADPQGLRRGLAVLLDELSGVRLELADTAELRELMEEMREFLRSEPLQIPTQYAYLGRAVGILLGVTRSLDPDIDLVGLVRTHALPYLAPGTAESPGGAGPAWERLLGELREVALVLYRLPHRLDRLLERAEQGDLRLRVELGLLARRLDEQRRTQERLLRVVLAVAAAGIATLLRITDHPGDAHAAWAATALLLLWALRTPR